MVNQSDLCMYVYCSVWNILDPVETAYFSGKNKKFKLSGNLYDLYALPRDANTRAILMCEYRRHQYGI